MKLICRLFKSYYAPESYEYYDIVDSIEIDKSQKMINERFGIGKGKLIDISTKEPRGSHR